MTTESSSTPSSVVYLGHLPFGFFEPQLRRFCAQFGHIRRCILKRSRKNGNSKGYAFVQFNNSDVASIVADTMNGYFAYGRVIKALVVPKNRVYPNLFKNPRNRMSRALRHKLIAARYNKAMNSMPYSVRIKRQSRKLSKKVKQLRDIEIDYDAESIFKDISQEIRDK